jgi:drug/metabolite transporter (DMT)-like permease
MKPKDIFQFILGGIIVIGFFLLLYFLIFLEIPEKNSALLNLIIGALIGSFVTIVGYFYGSSSGSAKKDETIAAQSKELNKPNGQGG